MVVVVLMIALGSMARGVSLEDWLHPDLVLGLDVASAYVYKGRTYNDGLVLQPWVTASRDAFSLQTWANVDVDDYQGRVNKHDLSRIEQGLCYVFNLGKVRIKPAYNVRLYSSTMALQDEQYISVGTRYQLNDFTRIGIYADYLTAGQFQETWYMAPYLTFGLDLGGDASLELHSTAGYIDTRDRTQESGWMHADLKASLIRGRFSLSATYISKLESAVLPSGTFGYDSELLFMAGVRLDI
ncbi:MAG TPA: hypothetical protein DCS43_12965 [Verrucomicrobia bacterium]|nr:hypothetical protein [Verrucomicrobiota bacterium]